MDYARRVFGIAAIHGLVVLVLRVSIEARDVRAVAAGVAQDAIPGFVPLLVAMSALCALVAADPLRYRAFMLVGILQKTLVGIATLWMLERQRLPPSSLGAALVELGLACLFVVAYVRAQPPRDARVTQASREQSMHW